MGNKIKDYFASTTESIHGDKIIAHMWEWYPVGKINEQDNMKAQKFEIKVTNRERIYRVMPDGSRCWYYLDTLEDTEIVQRKKIWDGINGLNYFKIMNRPQPPSA